MAHKIFLILLLALSVVTPACADSPLTVQAKHKPNDAAWKSYPVRTVEALGPLPAEPTLDNYGGRMDKSETKTGFFHTQKIKGRWWLIDPDGHLFINVGVVGVGPSPMSSVEQVTGLLRDNGFNGIGAWSATELMRAAARPLPYTVIHSFMGTFAHEHHVSSSGPGHSSYPNDCIPVFHPAFAAYCDEFARSLAASKDDPYLLGYFSDNELPLPNLDKFLALDPKDPYMGSSRQAAQAWLDARKGKPSTVTDITAADRDAWMGYVFDRYFSLTTAAIHKYDPHHLCLGPRLNGRSANSEPVFRAAGRYLDVVALNYYGVWQPSLPTVRRRSEWAGKPLLISEFYAKGADTGFANTGGAGWLVPTQRDRGLFYQTYTLGLLEAKNCVGWHWFMFRDNDPTSLTADPSNRDSNKGIVTLKSVPYAPLLEQMRALNQHVYAAIDRFDR